MLELIEALVQNQKQSEAISKASKALDTARKKLFDELDELAQQTHGRSDEKGPASAPKTEAENGAKTEPEVAAKSPRG